MVNIILICFKESNIVKKFDKKLKDENVEFNKESNDDWYNYCPLNCDNFLENRGSIYESSLLKLKTFDFVLF